MTMKEFLSYVLYILVIFFIEPGGLTTYIVPHLLRILEGQVSISLASVNVVLLSMLPWICTALLARMLYKKMALRRWLFPSARSTTPLQVLPQELRDKIWEYVWVETLWDEGLGIVGSVHAFDGRIRWPRNSNVEFLHTCRQFYVEASYHLYRNHCFLTRTAPALIGFLSTRNADQRRDLGHLMISIGGDFFYFDNPDRSGYPAIANHSIQKLCRYLSPRTLPGLRRVALNVDMNTMPPNMHNARGIGQIIMTIEASEELQVTLFMNRRYRTKIRTLVRTADDRDLFADLVRHEMLCLRGDVPSLGHTEVSMTSKYVLFVYESLR